MAERLFTARRFAEAETACRSALDFLPDSAELRVRLAATLNAQDRQAAALEQLDRATAVLAHDPSLHNQRGVALLSMGQVQQAASAFSDALRLQPDFAPARYNLGLAQLLLGDLQAGWRNYEARGADALFQARRGATPQPVWDGEPLHGRRVLLQAEQGYGDAIQFVRYAPLVAARGGDVVLECRPALKPLLQDATGVSQVVTTDEPLPPFDVRAPLLSLPRLFGASLASIPADVPYLKTDPGRVAGWQGKLASVHGHKVAFSWRGSPSNVHDQRRSLPAELLSGLAGLPHIHFFLVERREVGEAPPAFPPGLDVTDLDTELGDFAESAAAIECMDLTISVDTALAHLAGALGQPVWLLLPSVPDWRWLLDRSDSPWYPTARLFRQPEPGAWRAVLRQVRAALNRLQARPE